MRRIAIVSDIHGNLEALERVLDDIEKDQIKEIICLGDTVGYGPNQKECMDIARKFPVHLYGNHEGYLKAKLIDKKTKLAIFGAKGKGTDLALTYLVDQMRGKKQATSATGRIIELPEEEISAMQSEDYETLHAEMALQKAGELEIGSPEIGRFRWAKSIPKEIIDQIGYTYFTKIITEKQHIVEEYLLRIQRRKDVLLTYAFLSDLEKNKTKHTIGNALFVHDDPLKPGSGKYLIDGKNAEKLEIDIENRVNLSLVTKKNFPGIDYIFAGHSHVLPGTVNINGINIIYVGSIGVPRKDNLLKKYACYTIVTINDTKVEEIEPRRLTYSWEKTQRKMVEAGLVDKFKSD